MPQGLRARVGYLGLGARARGGRLPAREGRKAGRGPRGIVKLGSLVDVGRQKARRVLVLVRPRNGLPGRGRWWATSTHEMLGHTSGSGPERAMCGGWWWPGGCTSRWASELLLSFMSCPFSLHPLSLSKKKKEEKTAARTRRTTSVWSLS